MTPQPQSNQIFALVKQLHCAGIVHGNLKPRNIVQTPNGSFLLIDFTESITHLCPDSDQLDVCFIAFLQCCLHSYV
jgi:RIO-like serine/threonine protein kinase